VRKTLTWLPWILLIFVILGFTAWQKMQKTKVVVASDGVAMPIEKQQVLVEHNQEGGTVLS
jgi:serine protease DegS